MKSCFKRHVVAILVTKSGKTFHGVNWIENDDVKECPRAEGEGYEKCQDVCKQLFHAEEAAIMNCISQGGNPRFGTLYLSGHTRICSDCQVICKNWDIKTIITGNERELLEKIKELKK